MRTKPFLLFMIVCFWFQLTAISQNLILNAIDTTMYGDHYYDSIVLTNGATIHVAQFSPGTQKGKLILRSKSMTIDAGSKINATGKGDAGLSVMGHGGGAGHGGKGGHSNYASNTGGSTYGTVLGTFVDMGSTGDNGAVGAGGGGKGGGSVSLFSTSLILNGMILTDGLNGQNGNSSGTGGGGGSGGGILINCKNLFLGGTLSANGGNGGILSSRDGGGGGGGRVKIFYVTKNIIGNITANGGTAGGSGQYGFSGTVGYDNYPTTPLLLSPSGNVASGQPKFRCLSGDADTADLLFYKIEISNDGFNTIYKTYNQIVDPQGWSLMSYSSGDTAQFIPPTPLPAGHYHWRAYAYDGNVWSDGWNVTNPTPSNFMEFDVTTTGIDIEEQRNSLTFISNFPNPIKAYTTFSFSLAEKSFVSIKIFDSRGIEVASVVAEEMSVGNHLLDWYTKELKPGVYFYCCQTKNTKITKRIVIIR